MPEPSAKVLALKNELVAQLSKCLSPDAIISDPVETKAYECDALSAYHCPPMLVVLPASTKEVADTLRICPNYGVPVLPR
ncbi:MAG: FAD-binding oxidoreductase, partial [Devosiaceae bacterium]|nr:FAD-binding oxidoreductase [Devosiaceae bacterium]